MCRGPKADYYNNKCMLLGSFGKMLPLLIFPFWQKRGLLQYPQAYPSFVAATSLHTTDVSTPDSTFGAHNSISVLQHEQQNTKIVLNRTKSKFGWFLKVILDYLVVFDEDYAVFSLQLAFYGKFMEYSWGVQHVLGVFSMFLGCSACSWGVRLFRNDGFETFICKTSNNSEKIWLIFKWTSIV